MSYKKGGTKLAAAVQNLRGDDYHSKQLIETPELKAVIQLGATPDSIAEIEAKYKDIMPVDAATLKTLREGIAAYRNLRGTITDKHAELKKPILEEGRLIDAEKNKLIALIEPKEKALNDKRETYEKAEAAAKALAEKQRVDKIKLKIAGWASFKNGLLTKNSEILKNDLDFFRDCIGNDNFNYEEFAGDAEATKATTEAALNQAYLERRALEDREALLKAQQAEIDAQNAALKEKEAAAAIEQKRLDAEKADLEKQKAEIEPMRNIPATLNAEAKPRITAAQVYSSPMPTIAKTITHVKEVITAAPLTQGLETDQNFIIAALVGRNMAQNGLQFGNEFKHHLGRALCAENITLADILVIKNGFPDLWEKYSKTETEDF